MHDFVETEPGAIAENRERNVGIAGKLFRRKSQLELKPHDLSLREQVASAIHTFLSVRGLDSVQPRTAIVMRKSRDMFVIEDADKIDNRETVLGILYLKGVESYDQFKEVQTDYALRRSPLGQIALGHLADQLATRLAQQITEAAAKPRPLQLELKSESVGEFVAKRL